MEMKGLVRKLGIGLGLGLLIWIAFGIWADWSALKETLFQIPGQAMVLMFSFTLLGYVVRFLRWELYLRVLGIRLSLGQSAIVFGSGFSVAVTPGKAGEVLKSFFLQRLTQVEVMRTAPIVLAERATDLMGMLLLASWGIRLFPNGEYLLVGTLGFLILLVILLQSKQLMEKVFCWMKQRGALKRVAERLEVFYESSFVLFRWRTLILGTLLSTLSWGLECVTLYWVFRGLGLDLGMVEAVFTFAFSSIAGAVSMLPGGLGVAETSMTAILMGLGVERTGAVAATMLGRLATLWFGVILGVFVLVGFRKRLLVEKREGI